MFTPTFLPLLEAHKLGSNGHNKSSTAPPDVLTRAAEEPVVHVAKRIEVRRSSTEPAFPVKHTRKSSLRPSSSATKSSQQPTKPRKHVTLDIGDAIVDPATDFSGSEAESTLSPSHHSLKTPRTEDLPQIERPALPTQLSASQAQQEAPQDQQPVISTQQPTSQLQKPSTTPNSGPPAHNDAMFAADPAAPTSPPRLLDSPPSTIPPLEPYSRPSPAQASADPSAARGAEVSHFFGPADEAAADDAEVAEPGLAADDTIGSFVGGIDGDSGFDPADAGSVGYPGTSLGASYMEAHHSWRQSMMREAELRRRDREREAAKEAEGPRSGPEEGGEAVMKGGRDDDEAFLGDMEDL